MPSLRTTSALTISNTSERALAMTRLIADAFPSRCSCTSSRTRESRAAISSTISTVRSTHPLATTITSQSSHPARS